MKFHIFHVSKGLNYAPIFTGRRRYIDDVAPNGGGFSVWPGSHHRCWNLLRNSENKLHQANKE